MYVCICHAITEKDVKKAVSQGACTLSMLSEQTQLGTQCGNCRGFATEMLTKCTHK